MRIPPTTGPQYQDIHPRKGGGGGGQTTITRASTTPRTTQTTSKGSSRSLGSSSRSISSARSTAVTAYGNGGGRPLTIHSGHPFTGGPMAEATFISSSTGSTFHLLSDNSTVTSLVRSVRANCSSNLASFTSGSPSSFNDSAQGLLRSEQAIQYYRASSIVLTLEGYNNSATYNDNPNNILDSPLPFGTDTTLLTCLNYTIGQSAPLVGGASMQFASPSSFVIVSFVWMLWLFGALLV